MCLYDFPSFISVYVHVLQIYGVRGGEVFEALRYKPEGRRIDSQWGHWNFSLT
jgi:hypothetical protein